MTESETDRQKEIESLLTERRKFEAWLAQLDAKRDSAAAHVFERVHADYTKRLEAVRTRLQDEAGTLRTMVEDLEARLSKEQDRVTKKTDERAEAELRAMVGEYGEKEWNTTRSKLDSSIADLRAKFNATERELAELKELLSSVTSAPAPARPSVMVAAAETVAEALHEFATPSPEAGVKESIAEQRGAVSESKQVAAVEETPAPAAAPAPEAPRAPTPFDELAFLRSVAGTPSRPSGNAVVSKDPAAEPPKATRSAKSAPAAPPPPPPAPPVDALEAEPEPPVAEEAEPAAVEEAAASARTSAKVEEPAPLGAPTPRTSQAIRSLKCQECGTLNFPTEWYCERCGGELAAF
jgi:hypothetical protein